MIPELWKVLGAETVEVSAVLGVLNDTAEVLADACLVAFLSDQSVPDLPIREATVTCRLIREWTEFARFCPTNVTTDAMAEFHAKAKAQWLHHELLGWRHTVTFRDQADDLAAVLDEFAAAVRTVARFVAAELTAPVISTRLGIKTL